jgi:excisionase family DNA binding protein
VSTLLTTDEVAAKLRLSPWTVRTLVREGRLTPVRLTPRKLLFEESAVDRAVQEAQQPIASERA